MTPQTRRLVEHRHARKRENALRRWRRGAARMRRRAESFKKIVKQLTVFTVVGGALLCLGLALFSPILHIREIRIARSDPRIDVETVQRSLATMFDRHLFFLSPQEVASALAFAVPDLSGARIVKQYPSSLQIRLELDPIVARLEIDDPAPPVAAAGSGAVAVTASGAIESSPLEDFLTDEGLHVAYLPSQVQSSGGLMTLRIVDWGVRPEPGEGLLDAETLNAIRMVEEELRSQFGMAVREKSVHLRAREFHVQTNVHELHFDVRTPIAEQLQRYRLFLQSVGPTAAASYIDLRLKDKIVYK